MFPRSPKNLIDAYLPFLPFSEIHLFDVKPVEVPEYYSTNFNISVYTEGVRVGTRDTQDVISWLRDNVSEVSSYPSLLGRHSCKSFPG